MTSGRTYARLKRALDALFASVILVVTSPFLVLTAVAIKATSKGPVFYRGVRVGRDNRDFHMLKFRTMVAAADRGPSSTSADDARITSVGKFLRRFKLDELPQFVNVLFGTMSIVGPRPQVRWAVELYTDEQRHLLDVRPGITDFASLVYRNEGEILRGSADPDRDYLEKIAPGKISLGLYYVRHCSLWIDMKIIAATALAIVGVDPSWCIPQTHRGLAVVLPALEA
jgi:lipopolysaccharide/colanic/teichoic acid biosynthesis glycosyltransferase